MKLFALFIGLLITTSTLTAVAATTPIAANCVSKAEMAEIASHFTQFNSIAQSDYCFDGSETSNLLSALMFMRKTAFAPDMQKSTDELFSGKFASDWYKYFIGRIDDMHIEESCEKGVAAFVYGFGGKTMYVCPSLLTANFSALDRASIFIHEARHIDGYPHITCTKGPRKGLRGACDTRISAGGSYAVTVETYAQLSKYAVDLNPALRAYARSSAVAYADETFETPAQVQRSFELLAMTNSKDLNVITFGKTPSIKAMGQSPFLGHITMRSKNMILFPDDKTQQAKYLFTNNVGDITQSAGDAIIEYNAQTPTQRAELVDYHVAAQWNAKVYKSKVVFSCSATSAKVDELQFNKGVNAVGILHINGYDRVARSNYIITDSGAVYEFGCSESAVASLKQANIQLDQVYKRIYKIDTMVIGLTANGRLFQIQNGKSTPLTTPLDGQIYEIAPRETYTFFDSAI